MALVTYNDIKKLEAMIPKALPPVDMPLKHDFIKGVYVRSLFIPAGSVLVGKIHSTEHICIVAKGRIRVVSEEGQHKDLQAGDVFVSAPGTKRAGFALEDTVFINVHGNPDDDTDLVVLEQKLITPEAIGYEEKVCLG